ncbi:DNA recombination [Microdochium nivale]|nr:DNA recombination [Microdochium nivale]
MEPISTPRVSSRQLDTFVGKNVLVVGNVIQLRGEVALLETDGQVTCLLNREAHLTPGNFAQVIGKVNPDLSVKVLSSLDLGANVDANSVQSVIDVTHQYPNLFIFQG